MDAHMSFNDYEVIDDPGTPAGRHLHGMAQGYPVRASRLLTTIEDFIDDPVTGERMAPNIAGATVEIYLVPPRYTLASLPDAAALVCVDHTNKRIEFVELYDVCGPGFAWVTAVEAHAAAALAARP
jgi:hypothetical protein